MNLVALDRALALLWIEMLRHLWQSALVLILLVPLAHVLRSAPARWTHRLWLAGLAKLFFPLAVFGPLVGSVLRELSSGTALEPHANSVSSTHVLVTVLGVNRAADVPTFLAWFPSPFWTVCSLAYLGIVGWLIGRTCRDLAKAGRSVRAGVPLDGERLARFEAALRSAGVARDHVVVVDSERTPAVIGVLRPRTVIPSMLLDEFDIEELKAVLLHEDVHRRNGDPAIAVLQRIASSVFFFFPLLAPLHRRLRAAAEFRCDEDALCAGAEPQPYVRALARTVGMGLQTSPVSAALGGGKRSLLFRRLERLRQPWRVKIMPRHRVAIAASAAIVAAGILLPVAPAGVAGGPEPSIPELDRLWNKNRPISVKLEDAPALTVLKAIADAGGLTLETDGPVDCCTVSVSLAGVSLRRALEIVAAEGNLDYTVVDSSTLRVQLPDIVMPQLLTSVDAVYPKDAIAARAEGRVVLAAVIREDGTVGDVTVVRGVPGWPSFDESAIRAFSQRTYRPATKNGRPVSTSFAMRIDYTLKDEEGVRRLKREGGAKSGAPANP